MTAFFNAPLHYRDILISILVGKIVLLCTMSSSPSIVIVGGGMSGLSAASKLYEHGFQNVVVIEARGRIGGRVHSIETDKFRFEEGAQWLHGTKDNPLADLIQSNGIRTTKTSSRFHPSMMYTEHGTVGKQEVDIIKTAYKYYAILENKVLYREHTKLSKSCDVLSYLKKEWLKLIATHKKEEKKLLDKIFQYICSYLCLIDGCYSLSEVSLASYSEYVELQGGNYTFDDGYSRMLNVVAQRLPKEKIKLNSEVTKIEWKTHVKTNISESKVLVSYTVQSGVTQMVEADHVIITLPLGCLKELHETMFFPALPEQKISAIKRLGYGVVNKVILHYEKPFWKKRSTKINLLWDSLETERFRINNFDIFQAATSGESYLVGWLHGHSAIDAEKLSNDEVGDICTNILSKFMGVKIPTPDFTYVTRWNSDPFSRGSYSYGAVDSCGDDVDILSKPVFGANQDKPKLLFAGEATHRAFFSTVHGAYESGKREAQRIIDLGYKLTRG